MSIEKEVKQVIMEQLSVNDVERTANLVEDLQADSLDLMELVWALEETFDIDIADEQAEQIVTVNDVIEKVDELTGGWH